MPLRGPFLILILFTVFAVFAQTPEEKLALQYYEDGRFDLALPYYSDLSESQPENIGLYDRFLNCLIETRDFDRARKLVRKRLKKYNAISQYRVDEGYVLEKEGKESEAEKIYQQIVSGLTDNYSEYIQTASAFKFRMKYNWAIKVFEKGENIFEGFTDFGSQLALLYMETGNRAKGIEKYVNLVLNSNISPDQSKHLFEMNVTDSLDYAILRGILLKHIQKSPDNYALAELLKWTFIKQKDWNAAFLQTRALDKRLKESGERVLELGELCISNEAWETAVHCFEYVRGLGTDKPYYIYATAGLLETKYIQLTEYGADSLQLILLENQFKQFIKEQGYNDQSWRIVSRLAALYTRFLHTPSLAIDLLENFIASPAVRIKVKANAKLELGDAYVIDGDVWSSELLYAQVEKDFNEEALGQEAKFRRARLSYYRGDFEWAQLQLNVLKGATTQLISNNSIELALKISENLGIDSNYHALQMFARAELLMEQNKLHEAELTADSIPKLYPGHSLSDDILYLRAGIREKQKKYQEAASLYETLAIAFSHDLLADNAWFKLAELYEVRLKNKEKAMECYKKIVLDFPGSLFQVEARKNFRRLRGDSI